jgi:polysaccharide deacetylase 2 family uncharacterized protein YibQ
MAITSAWHRRGFELRPLHHALLGVVALLALTGAIAGGVSLFGDDRAAAPRKVLSLKTASDTSAARVSISEAAVDPAAITNEDAGFFDDPPPTDANNADDNGGGDAPSRPRFPASPLPKAPLAGYFEMGPNGRLPIITPDGRTPARAYARPFTGDANKPKIAVVVGGLGFNARVTQAAIDELPPEVTLSFVPYTNDLQSWIDRARARGHEVMIELPMEPFDTDANDTGPQTLLAGAPARDNIGRLENLLARASGYFGVTNYQGARFAGSQQASAPVAKALKDRGLVFMGNSLGPRTAFGVESSRAGLPFTSVDRIIDVQREAEKIDEQLLNLEALALQNGAALGSGFAFPVTIDQIEDWAQNLSTRGYVLAPASAVMESRTARR